MIIFVLMLVLVLVFVLGFVFWGAGCASDGVADSSDWCGGFSCFSKNSLFLNADVGAVGFLNL